MTSQGSAPKSEVIAKRLQVTKPFIYFYYKNNNEPVLKNQGLRWQLSARH